MTRFVAVAIACVASIYVATATGPVNQTQSAPPSPAAAREGAYRANNTGVAHLEQFNYEEAERLFREALKIQPDLALSQLNLAIALFYAGRAVEAMGDAREAAKRLPEAPQPWYVLGLAAKAENMLDEAAAAFGRVLEIDPEDAGAKIQLGQIHLQQRRFEQALPLFQQALAAEPYNVTAAYNVALALTRSGQAEEGRRAMERFETLRDSAYGVTYSQVYLGQGRYAEAIASTGAEPELVDPAPPGVRFSDATSAFLPRAAVARDVDAAAPGAQPSSGGVTLFDADGDGDLDLVVTGAAALRFFRNDDGRLVEDAARFAGVRSGNGLGAIAGDYDNDEKPDLFLLWDNGVSLLHQRSNGSFEDVSKTALPAALMRGSTAAFGDIDHDGDLDIVIAGESVQALRNNGDGAFTDITAAAGLAIAGGTAVGMAAIDFDNRRDVDLLLALDGRAPAMFRNMRDGTFRDSAEEWRFPGAATYTALAVGDINKDGYPDVFLGRRDEAGLLVTSEGQGRYRAAAAPEASRGAIAAQLIDYDNDGLLDLLTVSSSGTRLSRNVGGGRWSETTENAGLTSLAPAGAALQSVAVGDLDNDGDRDIVHRLATGELRVWRNEAGAGNRSLRVGLTSRVSNRSAVGSKVEMRAGSLHQVLETSSSTPAVAPADLVFGLGWRAAADVVRVLWPSGILQAETSAAGSPPTRGLSPGFIAITELDRKPSSCPYLFTWNGTRFEFVTDFMGGGEMGAWLAPAVWNRPDPDEYVRIGGHQLQPRDGRYELRMTNELEETLFVDRVQLLAIDHASDVDVFPNEGLRSQRSPFELTAVRNARPPVTAADEHGHDVLALVQSLDRRYPDDFRLLPIRGYAEPHELVLDLGDVSSSAVLLLTGWTDYAFSNDNVAASQQGIVMRPPSLQVRDAAGAWRTVIEEIGFPVGRPQTVVVRLAGKFLAKSREVRILTNMRIYWDQILVSVEPDRSPVSATRLDPVSATLRWRGFSEEVTPDGHEPFSYDYHRVSAQVPWKSMIGRYTREGDVRSLLSATDDLFVISRPGDEIALSFAASPAPRSGRARTFLLYAYGYSKEMNPRSASPDTVGPLPFRAMSGYPYRAREHYPRTKAHREYQDRYNTRVVMRSVLSIDGELPK